MINLDQEIREYGLNNKVPITKDDTLSFLVETINKNNSKQVLEIGTAIAFGSITMATETNCDHIDTLEIDKERFEIANKNIKKHGLEHKISTYLIDAMEFLKRCKKKYDFIYLDGPKGQYINYLPYLINILNAGGIIFADNLNFHGMVTGEIPVTKGCRAMIKGLHKYIDEIQNSTQLKSTIYTHIGDGVGVSVKIGDKNESI